MDAETAVTGATKDWVRALEATAPIDRGLVPILPIVIERLAQRRGDAPALQSPAGTLTYRELVQQASRCARWALEQGLGRGDVVGLLMPNCPDYFAIWLGLSRIGVITALFNTSLRGALLENAINSVSPRHVIAGSALVDALDDVRERLSPRPRCWSWGPDAPTLERLDSALHELAAAPLDQSECASPALTAEALLIYTSGTTGPPKAAKVSHYRVLQWTHWFAGMTDIAPEDRMYNCLPMYHSIGGVVATGAPLVRGATVVLRERFAVSSFWQDVVAERCTLFQYIGELCRYLLASPHQPQERAHSLRLCCGNGLRREVWEPFQERFAIPRILEYYAATEGSFSLYNCEGKVGSIGRIPAFLSHRFPVALVRFDPETGLPLRNQAGRCERCAPDEVGEAIGLVANASAGGSFEGYTDAAASQRKLLRDVFEPADVWYRTGDLMRRDAQGFFYFVDRVGDTFRWKGENVSTSDVTGVVGACPGVTDSAVYGVAVPHCEGRAGMAALVTTAQFSLLELSSRVVEGLPEYARPLFLRIVPALSLTGSFRAPKAELQAQGFDPGKIRDPLYLYERAGRSYVPLDAARYEAIRSGRMQL
jgi:fatty-acyl-CoA synthase